MDTEADKAAHELARLIQESERPVVFTGAGISTESGIPDFRGPGGAWTRYQPVMFDEFLSSHEARKRYWAMKSEFFKGMDAAKPNEGHHAIAELHRLGKLHALITQNIDGLHQDAGVPDEMVIELHGTNRWISCLNCGDRITPREADRRIAEGEEVPVCRVCGGWLKPATISFGQPMPERETRLAARKSRESDLFIVVGSSLVVYPAASMPELAVGEGAKLAIINLEPTPLDRVATLVSRAKAGELLRCTIDELREKIISNG